MAEEKRILRWNAAAAALKIDSLPKGIPCNELRGSPEEGCFSVSFDRETKNLLPYNKRYSWLKELEKRHAYLQKIADGKIKVVEDNSKRKYIHGYASKTGKKKKEEL